MNYFMDSIKTYSQLWCKQKYTLEAKKQKNEKKENEKKINCFLYKPVRKTFFDRIFENMMKSETNKRIENKKNVPVEKTVQNILKNKEKEEEKEEKEEEEKEKDIIPSIFFCLSIPAMVLAYLYIFRNRNRR